MAGDKPDDDRTQTDEAVVFTQKTGAPPALIRRRHTTSFSGDETRPRPQAPAKPSPKLTPRVAVAILHPCSAYHAPIRIQAGPARRDHGTDQSILGSGAPRTGASRRPTAPADSRKKGKKRTPHLIVSASFRLQRGAGRTW
ncbi:hypothetical protein PVAP13_5NG059481 [Panicum virgatum]|uniref:Uncharacterized protein n=1 Tax=Panicum virgatum TaxID=38727 RepID=A0A8T0RN66_PANVG|nr:hypothetical protein PVAP13_5NG059481 [Panicum virgatum]